MGGCTGRRGEELIIFAFNSKSTTSMVRESMACIPPPPQVALHCSRPNTGTSDVAIGQLQRPTLTAAQTVLACLKPGLNGPAWTDLTAGLYIRGQENEEIDSRSRGGGAWKRNYDQRSRRHHYRWSGCCIVVVCGSMPDSSSLPGLRQRSTA